MASTDSGSKAGAMRWQLSGGESVKPGACAALRTPSSVVQHARAVALIFGLLLLASPGGAESLRCNGASTEVGDSRLSVLYKCGEPVLRDSYCAPVFYPSTWQAVPEPYAGYAVPCLIVDEWIYDRGPGNLVATVRFRSGVVQSIVYGKTPH
jgi:hypothetical protein